jgi:hypothetical protein
MKAMTARRLLVLILVIPATVSALARESRAVQPSETQTPAHAKPAQPDSQLIVNGKVLGQEVPPRPREICVVCKRPIGTEGVVYLVKGQRFPLHVPACYEKFRKNPLSFLAMLQPHGAFLGASGETHDLSFGWFLAGLYVLVGLVFAALCAQRAMSSGRSPAAWFGAGLALNALGYLLLLTLPKHAIHDPGGVPEGLGKVPVTFAPQPCPTCGRMNHPAADRCADCGEKLRPAVSSEVGKAGLHSS